MGADLVSGPYSHRYGQEGHMAWNCMTESQRYAQPSNAAHNNGNNGNRQSNHSNQGNEQVNLVETLHPQNWFFNERPEETFMQNV